MSDKVLRTAREIKLNEDFLENNNINVKIGTSEKRNRPETVYIEISFWIECKDKDVDNSKLKKKIEKDLKNIYRINLLETLKDNKYFPRYDDNLFIANVPENINYNDKKNFVSIELYLHTINLLSSSFNYPLNKKKDTELYDESLKISNIMGNSEILMGDLEFNISQTK